MKKYVVYLYYKKEKAVMKREKGELKFKRFKTGYRITEVICCFKSYEEAEEWYKKNAEGIPYNIGVVWSGENEH